DRVHLWAAEIHEEIGAAAEPEIVGAGAVDPQGCRPPAHAPAHHLVARIGLRAALLDGYPGVDSQEAAPAHGARRVDLDDGVGRGCRIRRLARGLARELPPVAAGPLERGAARGRAENTREQDDLAGARRHRRTAYPRKEARASRGVP